MRQGTSIATTAAAAVLGLAVPRPGQAGELEGSRERAWARHIRAVDEALARRDVSAAEGAWHDAYVSALGSWQWEGLLEVGHASLRIGQLSGLRQVAAAKARNLYLAALFRARQHRSVEGFLRAAEAFAGLGDREVAEQCLRIARALAREARDPEASARVAAVAARIGNRSVTASEPGR
ncbi:MAG: hypothetical protein HY002_17410 [Candidatus Rokubacteria bacterium]|nr:hypothetical protein [Candidatus Rokubacteria bacterium]